MPLDLMAAVGWLELLPSRLPLVDQQQQQHASVLRDNDWEMDVWRNGPSDLLVYSFLYSSDMERSDNNPSTTKTSQTTIDVENSKLAALSDRFKRIWRWKKNAEEIVIDASDSNNRSFVSSKRSTTNSSSSSSSFSALESSISSVSSSSSSSAKSTSNSSKCNLLHNIAKTSIETTTTMLYRFPILVCVKQIACNSISTADIGKFLALPEIWFSESQLMRILYGSNRRCACENVDHANSDLRLLNGRRHRQVLLHLHGPNGFQLLRRQLIDDLDDRQTSSTTKQQLELLRKHESHVFIDEYGSLMRAFQAITFPCNVHRRDMCLRLVEWLYTKIRNLNESYRTKNLQMWEHQVSREIVKQERANCSLNYQLKDANVQTQRFREMYENVLRTQLHKPTVSSS